MGHLNGSLFLSRRQIRKIYRGGYIVVRREGNPLTIGPKKGEDKAAKIEEKIAKLRVKLNQLQKGGEEA